MQNKLGLCLIAKDYEPNVKRIVSAYSEFFDKIYVQLNGGGKLPSEVPENVEISTFKWVDDFAKARNALLRRVKTEYWFWMDDDDELISPEKLKELVSMMDKEELDEIFLPYLYLFSDNTRRECTALHYRERLIRTSHPFKWVGAAHETLMSDESPKRMKVLESVAIKHAYKSQLDIKRAHERNVAIFKREYDKGDRDPRLLYYFGIGLFGEATYSGNKELFKESARLLMEYTKVSGWEEQRYDAWTKVADCMVLLDSYDNAINALVEAMKIQPNNPIAYFRLGDLYLRLEQPDKAIEWLKNGLSKPEPETMEIIDPTIFTYRPLVSLAIAYFHLGRVREAKRYIDEAAKHNPRNKEFKTNFEYISSVFAEENTIKAAAWLGKFVEEQGDVKSYIDGLPQFVKHDLRLRPLWIKAHPAKKWSDKSIVFYCGEQWEEWGPDTLDKGMGGSEEAIVYLSRELAKEGFEVTVYNQRVEEYFDWGADKNWGKGKIKPVHYVPWETFNPEDKFNVFVAWRNPWMPQKLKLKAKLMCVDMHDTPMGHQAISPRALKFIDLVFFKSQYQRDAAPEIPDSKCVIIPNGIVPEQFKDLAVKRDPHKVIFGSSADRGLDVLLKLWPDVKKQVPDAELVWAYGWNSYDALHKGSSEHAKWKWEVIRDMHKVGAKELGRLSHEDLAKEFASCGVWAYPTSFPEIDCITAKKAQAAGCTPITSGFAALQTSVLEDEEDIKLIHEKPKKLEEFTKRLVKALKTPRSEEERKKIADKVLDTFGWDKVAKQWKEAISESSSSNG